MGGNLFSSFERIKVLVSWRHSINSFFSLPSLLFRPFLPRNILNTPSYLLFHPFLPRNILNTPSYLLFCPFLPRNILNTPSYLLFHPFLPRNILNAPSYLHVQIMMVSVFIVAVRRRSVMFSVNLIFSLFLFPDHGTLNIFRYCLI